MDSKITYKKSVQLKFDFTYSDEETNSSDKFVIKIQNRHCKIKKKHAKLATIININDCISYTKQKKEAEIINFIINNSKSF